MERFFGTFKIRAGSVLFCLVDDTLAQKTGKKIPGCGWHKDHAHHLANVFGHQWVLSALLYKDFLFPLWANLYHPKGTKGCGRFQTKVAMVKKILGRLQLPIPCKVYILADAWYCSKDLAQACCQLGYQVISQLKSNAILLKKPRFLISTNPYLSALDVVRYYAKRWKIEQMIKDLKQRLGFGD